MNADFNLEEEINNVLGAWNPMSVPQFLTLNEYKYCATQIALIGCDPDKLRKYLKTLVGEEFGLGYDDANPDHREDIENVVKELVHLFNKGRTR